MIKTILNNYKQLDNLANKILKKGLKFCFALCIISIAILLTYMMIFSSPTLYYIGISLFKLSITFSIEFLICALVVDSIKKELI